MAEISSLSTQYVQLPVTFTDPVTGNLINPTADQVQMAFTTPSADPVSGDWLAATWRAGGPPYVCQVLIGPASSKQLAKGNYRVWVKVTDNPEIPALRAGFLRVT